MKMYLYRHNGDWCLEDPKYETGIGRGMRYRYQRQTWWNVEHRCLGRWLNEQQRGELSKITGDHSMRDAQIKRRVREFVQRQP